MNNKIKITAVALALGVLLAGGATYAAVAWHGTDWITDGAVVRADYMQDNFDWLYNKVNDLQEQINNIDGGSTEITTSCTTQMTVFGFSFTPSSSDNCSATITSAVGLTQAQALSKLKAAIGGRGSCSTFLGKTVCKLTQIPEHYPIPDAQCPSGWFVSSYTPATYAQKTCEQCLTVPAMIAPASISCAKYETVCE